MGGTKHPPWKPLPPAANVGRSPAGVFLACGDYRLVLDFPLAGVMRVRLARGERFLPGTSGSVQLPGPPDTGAVEGRYGQLLVRGPAATVEVLAERAGFLFRDGEGNALFESPARGGHALSPPRVRLTFLCPPKAAFFGLGEKAWNQERSGRRWVLWNTDVGRYRRGTDPLYKSVPFLLCSRPAEGYHRRGRVYGGLFFDNPYRLEVDLRAPDALTLTAAGGPLEYYVLAGPTPAQVLARLSRLLGRPFLPPLWSLGYQQSRWSYAPARKLAAVAETFRSREIPCDVLYLDLDYMDRFRVFTWDRRRFPQPGRLLRNLAKQGFRVVAIVDPALKAEGRPLVRRALRAGHFLCRPDGKPFTGKVWAGRSYFPDFTRPATRRWWGEAHRELLRAGVAGIWADMNEPSVFGTPTKTLPEELPHHGAPGRRTHAGNHNLYGHLMVQAAYAGLRRLRPDRRPFILTRAAFAGTQRFAAVWTGDNASTWEDLRLMIPMLLGLSVSGLPFCGADVGGFRGRPTAELFERWLEAAALTPLCRNHTIKDSPPQEPWAFGPDTEGRARETIRLRYRFLPYLYTLFYEAHCTGAPVMRPLWYEFPHDEKALQVDDVFLLGPALLVAPVLRRGARRRRLYLPPGRWLELRTGRVHPGGRTVTVAAPLGALPLFLRQGWVLPTAPPGAHTGARPAELHLLIFPDEAEEARGLLYEDAGEGFAYERGGYRLTRFALAPRAAGFRLTAQGEGRWRPAIPRRLVAELLPPPGPTLKLVDGGRGFAVDVGR